AAVNAADEREYDAADDVAFEAMYDDLLDDEARRAVWEAWAERYAEAQGGRSHNGFHLFGTDGEIVGDIPPAPDAAEAAVDLLLSGGEPDVLGEDGGPVLLWKRDP